MNNHRKRLIMIIATVIMIVSSVASFVNSSNRLVQANDLDPASKILCKFEDGEEIVRVYSTDYFHYQIRSKSAMTSIQPVDTSWLNKLLVVAGYKFEDVNEEILGRPLKWDSVPETTIDESNENAVKVSAFDRFGVAGLSWSSYQGEWKYYHINPCTTQNQVSPTTFGTFYDGRLEPQSTHNEVSTSIDPRSIQFNKGAFSSFGTAFTDTISNALFSVTKGIVTLTIVFVGLAFVDVTELFGMVDPSGEGTTASGVFTSLFDSLFSGLVFIMIILTALYILYKGLIKRELRFAFNSLIKVIAIFIVAVTMSFNPSYWVAMPNKIAAYGQSLILSSMSSVYDDEDSASLCSTEVASLDDGVEFGISDDGNMKSAFEKTSQNMKSMIACNMWQTLLLEPWVRGQFGAEYSELSNNRLNNDNELWVGKGSVPVGNGEYINNWALFHLSTQTNAHAPADGDSLPVIVNGVNADWWRIVDALSDYEEEVKVLEDENGVAHEFSVPVEKEPTRFWQSWVGNNRVERVGVAFISIAFGIVGSIAPLVFGIASAVFGLGITLMMMTSPIFFLFGLWSGRGDSIFFGWLSALTNTVIKKIMTGILLILSIVFSMSIMQMIGDIGFIKSFLLMVITSSLLIKNKDSILSMLANVDFGGAFDPRQKANQFMNNQKRAATEVSRMVMATGAGAVAAKRTGQSLYSGALTGIGRQLRNKLYTSTTGMHTMRQMDIEQGGRKLTNHTCILCHKPLGLNGEIEIAFMDDHENYYCEPCAEEIGLEILYEVVVGDEAREGSVEDLLKNPHRTIKTEDKRTIEASLRESWITHSQMKRVADYRKVNEKYEWNDEAVQKLILENLKQTQQNFIIFKTMQMKFRSRVNPPPTPEPLHEYIDLSLINHAWSDGNFKLIEHTYKEAWKMWYEDNAKYIDDVTDEDIKSFQDKIDEDLGDITPDQAIELISDYILNHLETSGSSKAQSVYIMRDGKVELYNPDIDDTNKRLSD